MQNPRILAIESSCDDTSVAILSANRGLEVCLRKSQAQLHADFGGVVPEIAARGHLEAVFPLLKMALAESGHRFEDIDVYAATAGPGLMGSLLIGLNVAKTLSFMHARPFYGIHHLEAHLAASRIGAEGIYPAIGLLVSGGHSALYFMPEEAQYEFLGETRDDAVGEVYDKVGRALGLGANAGPRMDKLACEAEYALDFKPPMLHTPDFDFSFSGLKTACMNAVQSQRPASAIAAGLQKAAVKVLVHKTLRAAKQRGAKAVVVAGGVAANSGLRSEFAKACHMSQKVLRIPAVEYCTDNAAMVAQAALERIQKRRASSPLSLAAFSRQNLAELSRRDCQTVATDTKTD